MMRALWTAGSGMMAQQMNVDVIANNLANVNTTGYKKERVEFKDLLYETVERAHMVNDRGRPANLQVGHGAVPVATVRSFTIGNIEKTDNPLDFAIDGDGFFVVMGPGNEPVYTRDGSFKIGMTDQGPKLTTSDGYAVLDDTGNEIFLAVDVSKINVTTEGELTYTDETGAAQTLGQRLGIVKFQNRSGLESIGGNMYVQTSASGEPLYDYEYGSLSGIKQFFLESSNVQIVEEMVRLIVAQRAYEINSKSIQSADNMLELANNLRR